MGKKSKKNKSKTSNKSPKTIEIGSFKKSNVNSTGVLIDMTETKPTKVVKLSPLEEQIQKLQHKKNKIDYYNHLKRLIKEDADFCKAGSTFQQEVKDEIGLLIEAQINIYENDKEVLNDGTYFLCSDFSAEETRVLKQIADRAIGKSKKPLPTPTPTKGSLVFTDPGKQATFVRENKHLIEKRVVIKTESGQMAGFVCGLEVPNIVVKLGDGEMVRVTKDQIVQ